MKFSTIIVALFAFMLQGAHSSLRADGKTAASAPLVDPAVPKSSNVAKAEEAVVDMEKAAGEAARAVSEWEAGEKGKALVDGAHALEDTEKGCEACASIPCVNKCLHGTWKSVKTHPRIFLLVLGGVAAGIIITNAHYHYL